RGGLTGVGVVDEPAFAVPQGPRRVPPGQAEDDGDLRRGDTLAAQLVPDWVAVHRILGAEQLYGHQWCTPGSVSAWARYAAGSSRRSAGVMTPPPPVRAVHRRPGSCRVGAPARQS